jgi:hypothetical protein
MEHQPWKSLDPLDSKVEPRFIHPLYRGDVILPFRCLTPHQAVVPWDGAKLLTEDDEGIYRFPGLADWWSKADRVWRQNRSSSRLTLRGQLDYLGKLSRQFPLSDLRVVFSASAMYIAAAIVECKTAVIEHKLYWAAVRSLDEARYLTSVLNSGALTAAVRPLQSRGEHNPRDIDKHVFELPIPLYDGTDNAHQWLVRLSERAETIARDVVLPSTRFEIQRRRVRKALDDEGVAADIDTVVEALLI